MSAPVILKRLQQGVFEALASQNRAIGTGGGAGMQPMATIGSFGGTALGAYSTANSTTWVDITGTSYSVQISRVSGFLLLGGATCRITGGAGAAYVRASIVGFDNTASPYFAGADASNGSIFYSPVTKGPIQPGIYTVKLQVATDNGTTVTVDQASHQFFLFAAA